MATQCGGRISLNPSNSASPTSAPIAAPVTKLSQAPTLKNSPSAFGSSAATTCGWRLSCSRWLAHPCGRKASIQRRGSNATIVCGLQDYIGGDLLGFDLDQWEQDVEEHKALAIYPPHEGGYEGRYASRLSMQGYYFLDLTARGLGDVEAYLSKVHGVRPPHLGKQKIVTWYFPPEVDYRLSLLPPNSKGLVLWLQEAKVLSKSELQYLALLPTLQPRVKVIAECGTWRKMRWKPLREISGLDPLTPTTK